MEKKNVFETPDIYLSSAITLLLKTEPAFSLHGTKVFFRFAVSEDLYRVIGLYNAGIPINAFEYATAIKRLRAEMMTRKSIGVANEQPR
jgi:hypothetical protein